MSIKAVLAALGVTAAALTLGLTVAAAGNGTTVLRGQFPSNEVFLVKGVPTFFTFTCRETRIQRSDGSARDIAQCRLSAGQTAPKSAAHAAAVGYQSDFLATPGFAGATVTTNWHGVVTRSGHVTMVANFPAP
jgi:hypothetical protein